MTEQEDKPVFGLNDIFNMLIGFFAALGLISGAAMVGLYFGGFFHWLAAKNPTGLLSYFLGGV